MRWNCSTREFEEEFYPQIFQPWLFKLCHSTYGGSSPPPSLPLQHILATSSQMYTGFEWMPVLFCHLMMTSRNLSRYTKPKCGTRSFPPRVLHSMQKGIVCTRSYIPGIQQCDLAFQFERDIPCMCKIFIFLPDSVDNDEGIICRRKKLDEIWRYTIWLPSTADERTL